MPGVLVRIRSMHTALSKTERNVAGVILQNPERAAHRTVHEFANAGRVSVSAVSRFVRKLGFTSFKEFRVELARETSVPVLNLFQAITPDDADAEIARKVFMGNIKSLEDTLRMLPLTDLSAAARAICACRRLVFFGIGGSATVARDAAQRFSYLDFQADAHEDGSQILLQALRTRPGDAVFGISHSGRSAITVEGARIAKGNGALTIGISNYSRSPLQKSSRYFFCTSFPENRVKAAAISSKVAQLCILDTLYLLVARHKKALWDVERVDALTERMLRLQAKR